MDIKKLINLTESFLKAYGYVRKDTILDNAFLFSRPTGLGTTDDWLIYFHEKGREIYLADELNKLAIKYPDVPSGDNGRKLFLTNSPIGAVPKEIKALGFIYQVPAWFFDREFSSIKKLSALKEIEKEIDRYSKERIEQPYQLGLDGPFNNKDILNILVDELIYPEGPSIKLIVAPAGFGKTVLMSSLYIKLKEQFNKLKQRQEIGQRPLLMLPGHIKGASNLDDLIDNFIGDEYDYGVANKDTFKFWIKNNFAIWLLDGLEEFILKVPDEFLYKILEDYISASDSVKPQIVISIREPLLASNPDLRESIIEWADYGLKLFKLSRWEDKQKQAYFEKNLTIPANEKIAFIRNTLKNQKLNQLCSTPYFCSIITNLTNNDQMTVISDDLQLIEYAFHKICEREFEPAKGLDREIFSIDNQRLLLKMLVELKYIEKQQLSANMVQGYAELFLENAVEAVRNNQIERIKRHALLTSTGDNSYDFSDDIMKEYLTALILLDYTISKDLQKFDIIGDIEDNSFLLRYIAKETTNIDWDLLLREASRLPSTKSDTAVAFRNIIKVFLNSNLNNKEKFIINYLQNRNLSDITFYNLNLSGANFSCSSLKNTRFEKCNLAKATFDHCIFEDTIFKDCNLQGVTTRNAYFKSLQIGDKKYYDMKEIYGQLYKLTNVPPETIEPCQAAINLIRLLERVIRKGKGYWLPKVFLERIKCEGGISSSKCISEVIKHKLVNVDGDRIRLKIDMFDEIKIFINDQKYQACPRIIIEILNDICPETKLGCKHLPS